MTVRERTEEIERLTLSRESVRRSISSVRSRTVMMSTSIRQRCGQNFFSY